MSNVPQKIMHSHSAGNSTPRSENSDESKRNLLEQLSALPLNDIEDLVNNLKTTRETESLRACFPESLAAVAKRVTVVRPAENISISASGGANHSSCEIFEHRLYLSVKRTPDEEETSGPSVQKLEVMAQKWNTDTAYITGSSQSATWEITLKYGQRISQAYISAHDDPGQFVSFAEGREASALLDVILEDLGVGESVELNGTHFLSLILGEALAKKMLDESQDPERPKEYPNLRTVIEEKLFLAIY